MRFVGLDPSTKTGFAALDESGQLLKAKELTGLGAKDPKRMTTLIDEIMAHLQPNDFICIEGYAYGAKGRGLAFQYGLGAGIRMAMYRRNYKFIEITPAHVKKFATGKGNAKKDAMAVPIFKHWGFDHPSDNVRDAYVLAQIARGLKTGKCSTQYQVEIREAILTKSKK